MKVFTSAAFRCGLVLVLAFSANSPQLMAAISTVTVGDNFFSPSSVTINVNDKVRWTWTGFVPHSSTSNTGLWDSGIVGNGSVFTNTFGAAGTFAYHCSVHPLMTGGITVRAANVPPTVSITSPGTGVTVAAPWSGSIHANASDNDGSVRKVDFFAGQTLLGTVSNPPASIVFSVPSLAAGSYNLKAVATDNGGATNTSALVAISVVTPAPIDITAPVWTSPGAFRFSYSATPGLSYIIQKSSNLSGWISLSTNTAVGAQVSFTDPSAGDPLSFYSVTLAPNP